MAAGERMEDLDEHTIILGWEVSNRGNGPTESETDLRIYADGEWNDGEYVIGNLESSFIIPILQAGESHRVENLRKVNENDFWLLTFKLIGDNAIIAIVDIDNAVEERDEDCGNLKRFRDRFRARESQCDNVKYAGEFRFLPTPTPTPIPTPTPEP